MTIHRGFCALVLLLGLSSLFLSIGQPLLSSHSARQTLVAQSATIFLEEGWHPLRPKVRFFGHPGYYFLEFPIYQSLIAGLSYVSKLSVETTGRVVNAILALLFVWGIGLATTRVFKLSSPKPPPKAFSSAIAAFVLISPLVFALSQWVTIELLTCASAVWAFIVFFDCCATGYAGSGKMRLALFVLTLVSFIIKPNVMFTVLPFFAVAAWRFSQKHSHDLKRWLLLLIPLAVAFGIGAAWYIYGVIEGKALGSTWTALENANHLTVGQMHFYTVTVLKRFVARYGLYVIGPGSGLLLLGLLFAAGSAALKERYRQYRLWIWASLFSIFSYWAIFCGANYFHNYYQLATVFPLYLMLALLVPIVWSPLAAIGFALALAINLTVSGMKLTHQDKDWIAAIAYLRSAMGTGSVKPNFLVVSNWGASVCILGHYLDRYGVARDLDLFSLKELSTTSDWVVICDNQTGTDCYDRLHAKGFTSSNKRSFGKLDIYLPPSPK